MCCDSAVTHTRLWANRLAGCAVQAPAERAGRWSGLRTPGWPGVPGVYRPGRRPGGRRTGHQQPAWASGRPGELSVRLQDGGRVPHRLSWRFCALFPTGSVPPWCPPSPPCPSVNSRAVSAGLCDTAAVGTSPWADKGSFSLRLALNLLLSPGRRTGIPTASSAVKGSALFLEGRGPGLCVRVREATL